MDSKFTDISDALVLKFLDKTRIGIVENRRYKIVSDDYCILNDTDIKNVKRFNHGIYTNQPSDITISDYTISETLEEPLEFPIIICGDTVICSSGVFDCIIYSSIINIEAINTFKEMIRLSINRDFSSMYGCMKLFKHKINNIGNQNTVRKSINNFDSQELILWDF